MCLTFGIGCPWDFFKTENVKEEKTTPELRCLKTGMGCTNEVLEKIKKTDPSKGEWLCKTRGIGCGEAEFKTTPWTPMNAARLCANTGLGCVEPTFRTITKEELCKALTGMGCLEIEHLSAERSEELCRTTGLGCKEPVKVEGQKMDENLDEKTKMEKGRWDEKMVVDSGMWSEKMWGDQNWNPQTRMENLCMTRGIGCPAYSAAPAAPAALWPQPYGYITTTFI